MRSTKFFSALCLWAALTATLIATASGDDREPTGPPDASSQGVVQPTGKPAGLAWRVLPSLVKREKEEAVAELPRDPFLDRRPPPPIDRQATPPPRRTLPQVTYRREPPAASHPAPLAANHLAPPAANPPAPTRHPVHPVADHRQIGVDRGPAVGRTHIPAAPERSPATRTGNMGYHTIADRPLPRHPMSPADPAINTSHVISGRARIQPRHDTVAPNWQPSVTPPPVRQPRSNRTYYTVKDGRLLITQQPVDEGPRSAAPPESSLRRPRVPGPSHVVTWPPTTNVPEEAEEDKPNLLGRMWGWLPGQGDKEEADRAPAPTIEPAATDSDEPSFVDRLESLRPKNWIAFGREDTTQTR